MNLERLVNSTREFYFIILGCWNRTVKQDLHAIWTDVGGPRALDFATAQRVLPVDERTQLDPEIITPHALHLRHVSPGGGGGCF